MSPRASSLYGIGGMVLFAVIAAFATRAFYGGLQHRHSKIWEAFGQPTLQSKKSASTQWHLVKFILLRQHRALHDRKLTMACDLILICGLVNLLIIVLLVMFANIRGADIS
jgi:hypothetical protein